jgi:hypothetical protein
MNLEKLLKKLKSLSEKNQVETALFTAQLVLPVYESYFPDDNRVRNAIERGKKRDADAAYADAYAEPATAHCVVFAAASAAYAVYAVAAYAASAAYAAYYDADYDADDAVCYGIRAGAKKQTIYKFMKRLSAS